MAWKKISYEVLTPMFIGGAEGKAEFRIPAVRGALRFWFRAMAGPWVGNDQERVAKLEQQLFGGTRGGGGRSSAVRLRPAGSQPAPAPAGNDSPAWARQVAYLLGQGLYRPGRLTRAFLAPGTAGEFEVRADEEAADLLAWTLAALDALGGLGARVRRGFGGIRLDGIGELCADAADWTLDEQPAKAVKRLVTGAGTPLKSLAGRCEIELTTEPELEVGRCLPFPSFSAWEGKLGSDSGRDWPQALSRASSSLREYRTIERKGNFQAYRRRVTPEYRDVVSKFPNRQNTAATDFGVAAFGLPIGFRSSAGNTWTVAPILDDKELRRASPLWIRPLKQDANWRCLYHIFYAGLHPPNATLKITAGNDQADLRLSERAARDKLQGFLQQAP